MSLGAWGDEGNVPDNRKDTAIYQEFVALRAKVAKWQTENANDFVNDEQKAKVVSILDLMDELCDDLGAD